MELGFTNTDLPEPAQVSEEVVSVAVMTPLGSTLDMTQTAPATPQLTESAFCREVLDDPELLENDFAQSLLNQLESRGRLSEAQMGYVLGVKLPDGTRSTQTPKGRSCMRVQIKGVISAPVGLTLSELKDVSKFSVTKKIKGLPPNATSEECVLTETFPHMEFPFEYFNPVQSSFLNEVAKDNNVVVCASTSAGKTTIAEMTASYTIGELRKTQPGATVAYIGPLKALCKEKEEDWKDPEHPFSKYNVSVLTGDYILTEARKKELAVADIVCMSSEMLGSRIRRNDSEKNSWLNKIGICVVDESHLLTVEGRGPNLEVALLKFTKVNPSCRIVFLSATMPNVDELGSWLTTLNSKETTVLKSTYRPVDLKIHYVPYNDSEIRDRFSYAQNEKAKRESVYEMLQKHPKSKFIVFVHSKKTGRKMMSELETLKIEAEFHCADLDKETRGRLEGNFRSQDPSSLRVLVATSGLAWGINMPARRVLVTGIHRGMNKVLPLDVVQMCGRAGRLGLDDRGDAYVLVGRNKAEREEKYCKEIGPIKSQIQNISILAFHLVSEIAEKNVRTIDDALEWYKRTLAYHQDILVNKEGSKEMLSECLGALLDAKAIAIKNDKYVPTMIGRVSSWFYFSPFDVSDWAKNFRRIFQKSEPLNEEIAWAVANTLTNREDFEVNLDRTGSYIIEQLSKTDGLLIYGGVSKHLYAIFSMLVGNTTQIPEINGLMLSYRMDIERIMSALEVLDTKASYFKDLPGAYKMLEIPARIKYGIPKQGLELVMLPGIGAVTAKKLMEGRKMFTAQEFVAAVRMGFPPVKENILRKALPVAETIAKIGLHEYLRTRRIRT